ncbi:TspO/MBR family protein [Methylobrevis pamukkalensis]|uniref:TspO/MBR family protein n=1 Tax=Methylobrevis pamukkalensis TaxID=1439726 RepID=A0A1E3H9V7_9HYPH|nr:TspO/MBR family protein [Methylobrevis pamukkalensis]ODN72566.1 TspO/MBR family protein [Methylobrevis pamukkalensis]
MTPFQPVFSHRDILMLAGCLVLVALAGAIGSAATLPAIPGWYAGLEKPFFTPPNWVFGPAWTALYVLMAIALWRVVRTPAETPGRSRAIGLFLVQLVLNAGWSVAFFGLQAPWAGVAVIALLIAALLATIRVFRRLDRVAALLLLPYLAWVAFAALLNISVAVLNS